MPALRRCGSFGTRVAVTARQFVAETGETPARAVERLRCETALPYIEETSEPLDQIALRVGFGDIERMRRVCLRMYGQSPQALRRRSRAQGG